MLCKLALVAAALVALSAAIPVEDGPSFFHVFFRLSDEDSNAHRNLRITIHRINKANTVSRTNPVVHFNGTAPQVWHNEVIAEGTTDDAGELFIEVPDKGVYIGLLHLENGGTVPLIMMAERTTTRDRRSVGRRSVSLTAPTSLVCKDSQIVFAWNNNVGCYVTPMVWTPYNALSGMARLCHRNNAFFCPQPSQDPCPGTNGRRVSYSEDSSAYDCHGTAASGNAKVTIGENLQGYVYKAGYYEADPKFTSYDDSDDLVTGFYMRGTGGTPVLVLGLFITSGTTAYDNTAGQFYSPFKVEINSDCDVDDYGVGTVTLNDRVKCTPYQIVGSTDTLPFENSAYPRC